ncbi:MAG: thioredoxin family protein [Elusimicrobia bacterium]|nr:thioredoxin family protein [Elusimicrobiota bacterium]
MNTVLAFLALAVSLHAAPAWLDSRDRALADSNASGKPLLIKFHAPWCYSCYYMAEKVLSRPAFTAMAKDLVLLQADVDTPEGSALKARYLVTALPSFVVAGPRGEVLGRIAGEQTEADFLARLRALLQGAAPDPLAEAEQRLEQRLLAKEEEQAARDLAALAPRRMQELRGRPRWRLLEARLDLARGQGEKAAAALQALLAQEDDCELAYDVYHARALVAASPSERKRALLEAEARALESLSSRRLFVPAAQRCADFRTGVQVLAEVYELLGRKDAEAALLKRAAAFLAAMGVKTGTDRNHDDDRRFFMELAGDDAGLKSFYRELTAAYPSDYVYPYRYARYLLEKGDPAAALRQAEAADKLAYGANRLSVTKARARALAALGRQDEAKALLERDIKAGKAFPDAVRGLQEALDGLGAKKP